MSLGIPDDTECPECDTEPRLVTCSVCNRSAHLIDCEHQDQPGVISELDGTFYCEDCWPHQCAACGP